MLDDKDTDLILKCRCADCETEKKRLCQSGQLRQLLGELFAGEVSPEKVRSLYCRMKPKNEPRTLDIGTECLCGECELHPGAGSNYCKAADDQS